MELTTITFPDQGTFAAVGAACKWLSENGYSYGSMQRGAPIGIMKGDYAISKWRNLSAADVADLDGYMQGDFRNGPVIISFKNPATGTTP